LNQTKQKLGSRKTKKTEKGKKERKRKKKEEIADKKK